MHRKLKHWLSQTIAYSIFFRKNDNYDWDYGYFMNDLEIDYSALPVWSAHAFGVSFSIYRKAELSIEPLETEPYQFDGSIPLIFIRVAWFEWMLENKWLYTKLYVKKFGRIPLEYQEW